MTLSEMVSNVNAIVHPATNMSTFIKRMLNRAQKVFISRAQTDHNHKFSWLKLTDQSLTTVAGIESYALSPLVKLGHAIQFRDSVGNVQLDVMTRAVFNEMVPDPVSRGNPTIAYFKEFWPVQFQPSSASVLSLVSSSASDDGASAPKVKIEGILSSGVFDGEEVTLDGTTPALTTKSYAKILGISDNSVRVGTLTITSNAGAVTNTVRSPSQRQLKYPVFGFYPIPSGTGPIYYDAEINLPEILNDNDFSLIPEDYHDGLEDFACAKTAATKGDKAMAALMMESFNTRVMDAIADDKGPDQIIQVQSWGMVSELGRGRLPGMFPRD